jgi:hypothetical protein
MERELWRGFRGVGGQLYFLSSCIRVDRAKVEAKTSNSLGFKTHFQNSLSNGFGIGISFMRRKMRCALWWDFDSESIHKTYIQVWSFSETKEMMKYFWKCLLISLNSIIVVRSAEIYSSHFVDTTSGFIFKRRFFGCIRCRYCWELTIRSLGHLPKKVKLVLASKFDPMFIRGNVVD